MTFRTLSLIGTCTLLLVGCKKYDENDSLLHLRTPEARLVGTWTSTEVMAADSAMASTTAFIGAQGLQMTATFDKAGTVMFDQGPEFGMFDGAWTFNEDKSVLHISDLSSTQSGDGMVLDLYWEILMLEGEDLRAVQFRESNGNSISSQAFALGFQKQD